jgi:recombination protein RecT
MRPEIQRALPKHMDADRLARIALTLLKQTPALGQCTPESFLGALMTASQLGLEPGPLGEAYLVPYGKVCTFIPGYRGLIKLAWQSGQIESLRAETVCEHDTFEVHYGSDPRIEHRRPKLGHPRGDAIGWYALAKFKNGGEAFVVMDREEVDAIRKRSKASGSGPWVTDFNAMAKKTCVRQLAKWLPLSPELAAALVQDGQVRTDVSREVLDVTGGEYIEGEIVVEATGEILGEPDVEPDVEPVDQADDADQAAAGTAWPKVTPAGGAS